MELGGPGSQYRSLGLIHNLFTGLSAPTPIVSSPHSSLKDSFNVSHCSELSYGSWIQTVKSKVLMVAYEALHLPFLAPVTTLILFSSPFPSPSLHRSHTGFCVAPWISRCCLRAFAPLLSLSDSHRANSLPSFKSLLRCHLLHGPTLMTSVTWTLFRPCYRLYSQCLLLCSVFSPREGII